MDKSAGSNLLESTGRLGVQASRLLTVDPEAVRRIPQSIALRYDVLGVAADDNSLAVAVADISDTEPIERIRFATGMQVRAIAAPREDIRRGLADAYGVSGARSDESDPPAVRLWETIACGAARARASDLHFDYVAGIGRVRQRVDGLLYETMRVPNEPFARLIARIKLQCGMDIADRRQPQDGRMTLEVDGRAVDVRAACMPTVDGEEVVLRLLEREAAIPVLDALGMQETQVQTYRAALAGTRGCILACGPTGSGKTTTLYASMLARNDGANHLCSIEDPVEVRLSGVAQTQVNVRAGMTFAAALRSIVRMDPDVVLLGEIRDEETARAATAAALTGQLLLASLHAADAAEAVDRLVELGVRRRAIAASVRLIVAQRLLRRSGRSGGRIPIFEMLEVDDDVALAIAGGATAVELRAMQAARGGPSLRGAAQRLVACGEVTQEEADRALGRVRP